MFRNAPEPTRTIIYLRALIEPHRDNDPGRCITEWPGARTIADIPIVKHGGKITTVRRIVYWLMTGKWPSRSIRCRCNNSRCFNPWHFK